MNNIEYSQSNIGLIPTDNNSSALTNSKIRAEINSSLGNEFNEIITSPITGISKIRKVLHRFGIDFPALYDLDSEGDEIIFELDQYNISPVSEEDIFYLYLLYHLNDKGYYEFFVEVTDEEGINHIIEQDKELEEND